MYSMLKMLIKHVIYFCVILENFTVHLSAQCAVVSFFLELSNSRPFWINATFSSLAAIYPFTWSITTRGNVKTCPSVWRWFGSSVNEGARDIIPNSRRRIKANSYSSAAQRESGWQSSCEPPFPLSQSWVVHFCTAANGSRDASFTHSQWLRDPQQWACEWWCSWTMVQPFLIEHLVTATMVT